MEPTHLSEKRFKKRARFLLNAPKMQFSLRIAEYFYRFPIAPHKPRHKTVLHYTDRQCQIKETIKKSE